MADLDGELEAMEDDQVQDTNQAANVARWKALINDTELKAAVVFSAGNYDRVVLRWCIVSAVLR